MLLLVDKASLPPHP